MKDFIKQLTIFIIIVILFISIFFSVGYITFTYFGPDYKQGEYTMVYKVYYPNNPKTYTIKNNWPISSHSHRGSNYIRKTVKTGMFEKMYGTETIIETSAPIEVVSYTFKHKNN